MAQPDCSSNQAAGDYCNTATNICNLNGYCGNTSSAYTTTVSSTNKTDENKAPVSNVYCAHIDNSSWLSFIASSTSASLNLWVSNCSNNKGIQMEVLSTTDCYNFTGVSDCWDGKGSGSITAYGLTVGTKYFILVDGHQGDVCDYVIGASSGVLVVDAGADQTICRGQVAKIKASGADTYLWNQNLGAGDSKTVAPSISTTYTVIGTTSSECTSNTDSVTIHVNALPTVTAKVSEQNICSGDMINLTASGALNYSWDNGVVNGTSIKINNTTTYTVTGTDANNCTDTAKITAIVRSTNVSIKPYNINPDSVVNGIVDICIGESMILTAQSTGGDKIKTFQWSTTSTNDGKQTVPISTQGLYYVTATSIYNCKAVDSLEIEVLSKAPIITAIVAPKDFCNNDKITISTLIDYAGQKPKYYWTPIGQNASFTINNVDSLTNSGTYSVTVSNGCYEGYGSTNMTGHSIPINNIIAPEWICTGKEYSNISDEKSIYSVHWNTGDSTNSIALPSHPTTDLSYSLTSTNGYCSYIDSAIIIVHNPQIVLDSIYSSCGSTITLNPECSTVFSSYLWTVNSMENSNLSSISISDTGTYKIKVDVTDSYQCPASASTNVLIHPIPIIEKILTNTNLLAENIGTYGDTSLFTYTITGKDGYSTEQTETFYNLQNENFRVLQISTNEFGCIDTVDQTIHIEIPANLFVPSAFAPEYNSPQIKVLTPAGFNIKTYKIWIYDLWGNLLWYSDELYNGHPKVGWDGIYNNVVLKQDSYIWKVDAAFYNGKRMQKFGNVLLLR